MRNVRFLFAIAAVTITLAGCRSRNAANENVTVITALPSQAETVSMRDIVSKIEIIELEGTLDSYISYPRWFYVSGGKYYLDSSQSEGVYAFDADGRFLFTTAKRIGNGRNEYKYLSGFHPTPDGCIDIYSISKGFIRFDQSLNALASNTSLTFSSPIYVSNDIVAVVKQPKDSLVAIFYSLSQRDTIGISSTPFQDIQTVPFGFRRMHQSCSNDTEVLYRTCNAVGNSIFRLDAQNKTILEAYRYDLGKMLNEDDYMEVQQEQSVYDLLNTYNAVWDVFLNNRYMLAVLGRIHLRKREDTNNLYLSFYSPKTGEQKLIKSRMKDGKELYMIDYLDDEAIYTLFENRQMEDIDRFTDPDLMDERSKEIIASRTPESNIYIVKYYLK